MNPEVIEEVSEELLREWGYRDNTKYSDECWKIQFAGPSTCERCNHRYNKDKCTGLFIRHTMHNEKGFRVPFRRQKFPQSMLPGIAEWLKERQKGEEKAITLDLIVDEGVRRSRLIDDCIVDPMFSCERCEKDFWFECMTTSYVHDDPDDEEGTESQFCSDDCRMYHEEESSYCEPCGRQISYQHLVYNENIGDPLCSKCVKEEFLEGNLLSDFIDNDRIPPNFDLSVPDEYKHIKMFDEFYIDEYTLLKSFCNMIRNLQKRGRVLILRYGRDNDSDERGEVEVHIKPFSKNKLRKAKRY